MRKCGICGRGSRAIVRKGYLECDACHWRWFPNEQGSYQGEGTYWRPPKLSLLERFYHWWWELWRDDR